MSKEELIEHARAIKDFCMKQCHDCKDCPFVFVEEGNVCMCMLTDMDDYPTRWDLPEEGDNRQKTEWECEA